MPTTRSTAMGFDCGSPLYPCPAQKAKLWKCRFAEEPSTKSSISWARSAMKMLCIRPAPCGPMSTSVVASTAICSLKLSTEKSTSRTRTLAPLGNVCVSSLFSPASTALSLRTIRPNFRICRWFSCSQSKNECCVSQNAFSGHSTDALRAAYVTFTSVFFRPLLRVWRPRARTTKSAYARTSATPWQGESQEATAMGAAAPKIATASFLKHTRLEPNFLASSNAVKGSGLLALLSPPPPPPPWNTLVHMSINGPLGNMSVSKICRPFTGHFSTASARNVLKKSSELWKKLANVSRSTSRVGWSTHTSHCSG
mmetsp:Transcript_43709/g.88420  ORF Transcript_43709/g.88420 Transcript_43709/m.88420 type:complete len:311 (-) Transcript_43709:404-1336(-)